MEDALVALSHDYPQANALRVLNIAGDPVVDATVRVYSAVQYAAGDFDNWVGATTTDEHGHWRAPIHVYDATTWIIHVQKSNSYGPAVIEVVTEEDTEPTP